MRHLPLSLLLPLALAGCSLSHSTDDERPDASMGDDGGPGGDPDSGPVVTHPDPGPCGDEPEAPECRRLCDEACEHFASCGGDFSACIDGCYDAYACPGETPGHDAAICGSEGYSPTSCTETCRWVSDFGGYGRGGPPCPDAVDAGVPAPCEGRSYCDCNGECAPLIDLTPGCVCPCDDPFNCTGELCDCACGGAEYMGCAPAGLCGETEVSCSDPEGAALVDGCPVCPG